MFSGTLDLVLGGLRDRKVMSASFKAEMIISPKESSQDLRPFNIVECLADDGTGSIPTKKSAKVTTEQ
jgi:hypothetical protein